MGKDIRKLAEYGEQMLRGRTRLGIIRIKIATEGLRGALEFVPNEIPKAREELTHAMNDYLHERRKFEDFGLDGIEEQDREVMGFTRDLEVEVSYGPHWREKFSGFNQGVIEQYERWVRTGEEEAEK